MKDFSNVNLGMNEADKDVMLLPASEGGVKQTRGTKAISTVPEAVATLLNCLAIWGHLHPCDYGTLNIVRFLY